MPDQPDDARKRQQRGVFPPFFAPRKNGRGDSTPTPPSGSWRRVSRLFTPPEVARQRRTPAAPQAPYTPPSVPESPAEPVAEAPEEVLQPSFEASEALVQPEVEASDAPVQPGVEARSEVEAVEASDVLAQAEADADAPWMMGSPGAPAEQGIFSSALPDLSMEAPVDSALPLELEQAAADALGAFDPMAFDDGADNFVVESLGTEPISLAPSDVARMDVDVALDSSVYSAVDDEAVEAPLDLPMDAALHAAVDSSGDVESTEVAGASGYNFAPGAAYDVVESIENYLADDATLLDDTAAVFVDAADGAASAAVSDGATPVEGAIPGDMLPEGAIAAHDDRAQLHDEAPFVDDNPVADGAVATGSALDDQAEEVDPWAGAELPEPAFGSLGWPSSEAAALAAERPVEGVDEMSAALAWSDSESTTGEHERPTAEANGAEVSNDEALSGMAHELRDSSSAWVTDADVADDDADVSARARFYGGGERTPALPADPDILVDPDSAAYADSMGDPAAAPEASGYTAELAAAEEAGGVNGAAGEKEGEEASDEAGDDSGAAIADALARVAARIRAGEVDLPSEVVGASDESALAAALAALLRGPRR